MVYPIKRLVADIGCAPGVVTATGLIVMRHQEKLGETHGNGLLRCWEHSSGDIRIPAPHDHDDLSRARKPTTGFVAVVSGVIVYIDNSIRSRAANAVDVAQGILVNNISR